jgi:putative endonuclease
MSQSSDLGHKGEDLAVKFLKDAGFSILYRNWVWGKNEIDIVAENRDFIVFAEVKTRTADFLDPLPNVISAGKQKSIILAAEGYVKRYRIDKESRFDVITVVKKTEDYEIEHIPDAFYPTLR